MEKSKLMHQKYITLLSVVLLSTAQTLPVLAIDTGTENTTETSTTEVNTVEVAATDQPVNDAVTEPDTITPPPAHTKP